MWRGSSYVGEWNFNKRWIVYVFRLLYGLPNAVHLSNLILSLTY